MKKYSEHVVKGAIKNAVYNYIEREKRLAEAYIKLNPQDRERRNNETVLIVYAAEMAKVEIMKELEKAFAGLETLNK